MYGLVNRSLGDMLRDIVGEDGWTRIKARAGVEVDVFVAHDAYADEVTASLVAAAAVELGTTPEDVLQRFGVHWVCRAARHYEHVLTATGRTLPEFLRNLPNLHTRVALSFRHLEPPTFTCEDVAADSLVLRYESSRAGLLPFLKGLLRGLGVRFATPLEVTHLGQGPAENEHRFLLRWGGGAS